MSHFWGCARRPPTARAGAGGRLVLVVSVLAGFVVPVAAASASSPASAASSSAAASPRFTDGHGLHVLTVTRVDDRDYNVRVLTAALGRPVDIRILLPAHYAQHPTTRYPVLYLFHGTSGRAADWIHSGNAEATTAPYGLITVMPDCGFAGDGGFWFTNWVSTTTSHGPSQFETYLIDQLVPWTDANLRTIAARDGRALAGLSQGGYGSTELAARHPDMFVAVGSFSGAPEIDRDPDIIVGATAVIEAIAVGDDHVPAGSMFGSRVTHEINWQGHDPSTLMTNLRGMGIFLWTGAGVPGRYDTTPNPAAVAIEALVHASTQHFHDHLVAAGIASYYDDYTYGTHSFPYWARDLRWFVPMMMATFAHPPAPRVVSYLSIDRQWTQWGYSVSISRPAAQQFSSLQDATVRGFTLQGSGSALVTTPASYRPGSVVSVSISGPAGTSTQYLTVGRTGRLTIGFPFSAGGAMAPATATVAVAIHPY